MPFDISRAACKFKQAEDIVSREIAGEVLLVPIVNNMSDLDSIYTLNDTGAFIWSKMDGFNSLSEICDALHLEFEVSSEEAWGDIIEFVDNLQSINVLIEVK